MPAALVAHTAQATGGGGGFTSTADIDTTGANLIVIGVIGYAGQPFINADSKSNDWSHGGTSYTDSNNNRGQWAYCKNPTVGSGHHFDFSSPLSSAVVVMAFSGADTTGGLDVDVGANGHSPGSATPSAANEIIVCLYGSWGTGTPTVDSSFTRADGVPYSAGVNIGAWGGYLIQGAAAAVNPAWTQSDGGAAISVMASFQSAATGVTVTGAQSLARTVAQPGSIAFTGAVTGASALSRTVAQAGQNSIVTASAGQIIVRSLYR